VNQSWIRFENKLDRLMNLKMKSEQNLVRYGFDFRCDFYKKQIDEHILRDFKIRQIFGELEKKYDLSKAFLRDIFVPFYDFFDLEVNKAIEKFDYFVNIFGSVNLLCRFIKNERCSELFKIKSIFTTPIDIFEHKIDHLQTLFKLDRKQVILLIVDYPYYINITEKYLSSKIDKFSEILNTTKDVIIKNIIRFPHFLYTNPIRISQRLRGFAQIYNLTEETTKEIFLKYPLLVEFWISTHKQCHSFLKKISDPVKIISKYPYIYNCLYIDGVLRGEFDDLNQMLAIFDYISEKYGVIEDIEIDKNGLFAIVKSNELWKIIKFD